MQWDWVAVRRGEASDTVTARVQKLLRGLESVQISQSAPNSVERSLNRKCRELFDTLDLYFQHTNVLLGPTNRRYTLAFTQTSIANWDIMIERTAAIEEQDSLGFARASELMQQFRETAKQWKSAQQVASYQRRKEGGLGVGQGVGGYQKALAQQQKRKQMEQHGEENTCFLHHVAYLWKTDVCEAQEEP